MAKIFIIFFNLYTFINQDSLSGWKGKESLFSAYSTTLSLSNYKNRTLESIDIHTCSCDREPLQPPIHVLTDFYSNFLIIRTYNSIAKVFHSLLPFTP
jgi:hypothetical protein